MATRPRWVRIIKPSFIRKGSYTSSRVPASSDIEVASVPRPTGPPLKVRIRVLRILLSIASRPLLSILSLLRAKREISRFMRPSPRTWAKSRTLLSRAFAIRDKGRCDPYEDS